MEARYAPRFKPKIAGSSRSVLGKDDPVDSIERCLPDTTWRAGDLYFGGSAAQALELDMPIGNPVWSKLAHRPDVILTRDTQERSFQSAGYHGNVG